MKLATTSQPLAQPLRLGKALPLPASVALLADHLDATLAMGEDLLALRLTLDQRAPDDPRPVAMHALVVMQRHLVEFVRGAKTLELGMTARLMQARKLAQEFRRAHPDMAGVAKLFVGGTAFIEDLIGSSRKAMAEAPLGGEEAMAFLRSRAIIAADAPGLAGLDAIHVSEDALLLGQIRLGEVMDLVARFLDTLDAAFDLYPDTTDSGLSADKGFARGDTPSALTLQHSPDRATDRAEDMVGPKPA